MSAELPFPDSSRGASLWRLQGPACLLLQILVLTMGARYEVTSGCDRVRRLAPAAAVGMGGRRAHRRVVAGRRGRRPHSAAPPHRFFRGGGRNSASSWRAHAGAGAGDILAPGPGSVRTGRLPAAGRRSPDPGRCSGEGGSRWSWLLRSALACRWHRPGLARWWRVRGRVQPRRQAVGHRRRRRRRAAVEPGRWGGPFTCMPAGAHLGTRSVSHQADCPLNAR
jgi:hypothetical protein